MQRKDIEYVLRRLGVDTRQMKQSGDWWMVSCPLARWTHESGTDLHPSFGIREGQGVSPAHCFACGFKGSVISLIREYGRYGIRDGLVTKDDLDELVDYVLLAEDDTGDIRVTGMMLDQPVVVPQDIEDCLDTYHPYFADRGIDEQTASRWKLGWHDMDDRVLFPVFKKEGKHDRLMGVIGRTVVGEEPKWKNYPPKFKKSECLFGEWLKPKDADKIVVVEGPIDAIKVNDALEKRKMDDEFWCVALMGAEPSDVQLDKLVAFGSEVICMLDNDASGKMGTLKLAGGRIGGKRFKGIGERTIVSAVMWPEEVNDPGELEVEEIIELIEDRHPMLEIKLRKELKLE
jgi:hypothetical protein